jgi:hypothetical protein
MERLNDTDARLALDPPDAPFRLAGGRGRAALRGKSLQELQSCAGDRSGEPAALSTEE